LHFAPCVECIETEQGAKSNSRNPAAKFVFLYVFSMGGEER